MNLMTPEFFVNLLDSIKIRVRPNVVVEKIHSFWLKPPTPQTSVKKDI